MPQLTDRLAELRLRQSWEAAVGPEIARRARPGSLTEGCLTVVVDNSPWLQELNLRQADLLARIRARSPSVHALRLTVGALPIDAKAGPIPGVPSPLALSEQDQREIEDATAAISDAALAATARRLLARAWQASGAPGPTR